jgi:hypothetical protein
VKGSSVANMVKVRSRVTRNWIRLGCILQFVVVCWIAVNPEVDGFLC